MNASRSRRRFVLLVALACAAGAGVGVLAWVGVPWGRALAPVSSAGPARSAAPEDVGRGAGTDAAVELAGADAPVLERESDALDVRAPVDAAGPCVRGTLVLDGAPVAGARVELYGPARGWHSVAELEHTILADAHERNSSLAQALLAARTSSDASGAFALPVPSRGSGIVLLHAVHDPHELVLAIDAPPGEPLDLGTLAFPATGRIRVRVNDGERLPSALARVVVRALDGRTTSRTRWLTRVDSPGNGGDVVLQGVPAGWTRVSLELDDLPDLAVVVARVESGATQEVELTYTGQDLRDAIWVRFHSPRDPDRTLEPDDAPALTHVRLLAAGVEAARATSHRRLHLFADRAPGSYELVVDDPRFVSLRIGGLQPGRGLSVPIEGSSSLSLRVIDAATGAPVRSYDARLSRPREGRTPSRVEVLQRADAPPPAHGVYAGIVPGWSQLVVSAAGRGATRVSLRDLRPGQMLPLEVVLGRTTELRGRVIDGSGAGVAVEVVVREYDPLDLDNAPAPWRRDPRGGLSWRDALESRPVRARTRSAADGRFVFEDLPTGAWLVNAEVRARCCAPQIVDLTLPVDVDVRLTALELGSLQGRVFLPPDAQPSRCTLRVRMGWERDGSREPTVGAEATAIPWIEELPVDRLGAFRLDELPAGRYAVDARIEGLSAWEQIGEIVIERDAVLERTFDLTPLWQQVKHMFEQGYR